MVRRGTSTMRDVLSIVYSVSASGSNNWISREDTRPVLGTYRELVVGLIISRNDCWMRHRGQKRFEAARAVVPFTIDKETWRPVDSGTHSALEIFPNTLSMSARNHFLNETHFVQAERDGVFRQRFVIERILVGEQRVMHRPKASLFSGSLGRFSRMLGMRVHVRHRKMPEGKTEIVPEATLNFSNDWLNFAANGAFVISVLQQRNWRVNRALQVITLRIRQFEVCSVDHFVSATAAVACLFCKSSSAERIPSAPGLTPIGETKLQ